MEYIPNTIGGKLMYLWNVKALVEDLKANKVYQKEKMKYLLVSTILEMLISLLPLQYSTFGYLEFVQTVLYILILTIGILLCYEANSRGDNKEFVERFICISLPLQIRISLLFIIVMVAELILFGPSNKHIISFVNITLAGIIFFTRVRSYIIDISGANNSSLNRKEANS